MDNTGMLINITLCVIGCALSAWLAKDVVGSTLHRFIRGLIAAMFLSWAVVGVGVHNGVAVFLLPSALWMVLSIGDGGNLESSRTFAFSIGMFGMIWACFWLFSKPSRE
jgi:hypothetical protein